MQREDLFLNIFAHEVKLDEKTGDTHIIYKTGSIQVCCKVKKIQ